MSRGFKVVVILITVLALLGGVGAIVFVSRLGPYLKERIVAEAKKRGVLLELEDASVWPGSATLSGVKFRLEGVGGLAGEADRVDVKLDGWAPTSIHASTVRIAVEGSAAELAMDVSEWTKNHPGGYALDLSANHVHLAWRADAETDPWLVIAEGSMARSSDGITFEAKRATVAGVDVGAVGATWAADEAKVVMGFGKAELAAAPVQIEVQHSVDPATATVTLAPTPLDDLASPLGVALPVEGVAAKGKATMTFDSGLESGPVTGRLEAALDGYVPPHPVELNGFVFGSQTTLSSDFSVSPDRRTVDLTNTRVTAGAFSLAGGGKVQREATHATVALDLRGNLPCGAIADSAAKARMGSVLGKLLGKAARQVVEGSVGVTVEIRADTQALEDARVVPKIGVGCGLKPLEAKDLVELGVDEDVAEIIDEAAKTFEHALDQWTGGTEKEPKDQGKPRRALPRRLPPFPSDFPGFPGLSRRRPSVGVE